jgi:hypothetical protein
MNPLDDHELLLWAMRAGLTRDEVRQAVRRGLDAGRIPRQRAHGGKRVDRLILELHDYLDLAEAAKNTDRPAPSAPFIWRLYRLWKAWGVSPLELMQWPTALVEGFQACDVVKAQRNLPVEVGDAS